ncbi:Fur family transcriptional regulator [Pyxidicoccus parkwayensis]|nr:Fur family transcriptional regulator [Pyxidicoccus parkwaysis]
MRVARKVQVGEDVISRAVEAFRIALRAKSQNMSSVREAIVRAAVTYDGHFSVEDLVQVLHGRGVAGAHMATVYRAVPLLLEAKIIQPALVSRGDRQLYEAAFEQEHHDHLVCSMCGKVVEFQSEALEALQREIAERYGFELDEHVMELSGRCSACSAKHRKHGAH